MSDRTAYGASFYAETMRDAPERVPLGFDLDVEVCVVGGGLAGLTAAYELACRGFAVALLERQRIAWNASGRNDGFVLPGFAADAEEIVERVGLKHARELWELSEAGLHYVRRMIREHEMAGVDPVDGWLHVSKTDEPQAMLERVALLGSQFGANVEGWSTEEVRDRLKSRRYFQAVHYRDAFHIHPLNYALGLAALAEQAGVRIYEGTPALDLDASGIRKRIATPSARVRAEHVVIAAGPHLGSLIPRLAATIMPITSYVITTRPIPPEWLAKAIAYRGAVSDTDWADSHYRIVDGNRLMWSGRMTTWPMNPKWFADGLAADIVKVYPQLAGLIEVEHVWSGTLGRTVHRMPQVGMLAPGLWVAGGFGGHGLNTTAMAGELVARGIAERDRAWQLFTPYELIWAGGVPGRIAGQALYWWNRAVEAGRERLLARTAPAESDAPHLVDAPASAPPQVADVTLADAQAHPAEASSGAVARDMPSPR